MEDEQNTPGAFSQKHVRIGLGDAIRRLMDLEMQFRMAGRTSNVTNERDLLLRAINRIRLQLGFDCNADGIPDTIEIFHQSTDTSCCRLSPDLLEEEPLDEAPVSSVKPVRPPSPPKVSKPVKKKDTSRFVEDVKEEPVEAPVVIPQEKKPGMLDSLFGKKVGKK